jgi:hypothetical protein
MRNDHVFYGFVGGAHPTPETVEDAMRRARRLRSEALHELFHAAGERVKVLFRRRPARRLQPC